MATVALAAGVAMPIGASADHQPGHDKGPGANNDLTISASPDPVVWGNTLTITGRLRGPENTGKTIELQENPFPYPGPFKPVGAPTTTNDKGEYTFRIRPFAYTDYRTVAKTDPEVISESVRARVRMRISRRVDDRTPAPGTVVMFSGFVGPAHDGRTVFIQRRNADGVWRTKARTTLVDAGEEKALYSAYARGVRVSRDGVYRVAIRRDADHLGNKTRVVRLNVQ